MKKINITKEQITRRLPQLLVAVLMLSFVIIAGHKNSICAVGNASARDAENKIITQQCVPLTSVPNSIKKEDVAKEAFKLANIERKNAGLSELMWNEEIYKAAALRADEASKKFSHMRPNGQEWYTANADLLYGENLAKGYNTANEVVKGWMNSATHKANILDTELQSGAIAICVSPDGQWFWAQEFGY